MLVLRLKKNLQFNFQTFTIFINIFLQISEYLSFNNLLIKYAYYDFMENLGFAKNFRMLNFIKITKTESLQLKEIPQNIFHCAS